jgi:hypothetical protein
MNHLAGLRVILPSGLFHRSTSGETKLPPDETVFPAGEGMSKRAKVNKALTR